MAFILPRKKSKSSQSDDGSVSNTPAKPRRDDLMSFATTGKFLGSSDYSIVQQPQRKLEVKAIVDDDTTVASTQTDLVLNETVQQIRFETTSSQSQIYKVKDKMMSLLKVWPNVSVKIELGLCYFGVSYHVKGDWRWTNYCDPCYVDDDKLLYPRLVRGQTLHGSIKKGKLTIGYYDTDHEDYMKKDQSKAFVPILLEMVEDPESYATKAKEQQTGSKKQPRSSTDEEHQDDELNEDDTGEGKLWFNPFTSANTIRSTGGPFKPAALGMSTSHESTDDEFEMIHQGGSVTEKRPTRVESRGKTLKGQMEVLHSLEESKVVSVTTPPEQPKQSVVTRLAKQGSRLLTGKTSKQ